MRTLPTYFISHGGGPWLYMDDFRPAFRALEASLQAIPREVGVAPAAVLMISGHWEAPEFTVMSSPRPPMLYDYSGFPEHTYRVSYPAPGSPQLAERVQGLLQAAGIAASLDSERGFDHGAFVPLAVMYPSAQVPVLQLSLKSGLNPAVHLAAGRALAPLRHEGILILGSGLSYHNLRRFGPAAAQPSRAFDEWLQATLVASTPAERAERLLWWTGAPSAREAHPHADHLLPLMVAVGAAENEKAVLIYHEDRLLGGVSASSFRFGESWATPRDANAAALLHEHHVSAEKATRNHTLGKQARVEGASMSDENRSLSEEFIRQQRQRLATLREQLLAGEARRLADARTSRQDHAVEAGDNADKSQDNIEDEISLALHDVDKRRLQAIERALQKIAEGSYGLSDISGKPIPKARLDATPEATLTLDEQQATS